MWFYTGGREKEDCATDDAPSDLFVQIFQETFRSGAIILSIFKEFWSHGAIETYNNHLKRFKIGAADYLSTMSNMICGDNNKSIKKQ